MSTAKIIVNPYAGRWKAQGVVSEIERTCQEIGLTKQLRLSERWDTFQKAQKSGLVWHNWYPMK